MKGLSSSEARAKLAEAGPNEPVAHAERSAFVELAEIFANPLVTILLVASIASAFLGDLAGAIIIVTVLGLGTALNFSQTYRSRRAAERLREGVAPTATVLRDDRWIELPRREIVPGDLVRLSAGDLVPADASLESARDLHTQESSLTGESLPVEKAQGEPVWLGTSVVSGTGEARVTATGTKTKFGEIAERLELRPPPTEFDRGIRRFGFLIMRVVFFLVLFILIAELAMHRNAMQALLFAVALAVGLTPEFLPMITSVTLAKGAVALAREKVIVKHLSAMQNLGSIDVLCSDKTGTLTSGKMTLASSSSDDALRYAAINAAYETGIKSPLDAAILAANADAGVGWTKRDEVPFDFERRRISVLVSRADEWLLITKGAPEAILPLTRAGSDARETYDALSREGKRVIAVAHRQVPAEHVCTKHDERDLVFDGFVAFADPPLDDAAAAIRALEDDGVAVKVLTGDGEHVARHVCSAVGIDASEVVLGDAIDRMNDAALEHVVERASVFARVSPAGKNRIVRALQRRRHVVGFMGDGINDAPSLHAADVGISVSGAVDVAREAADVILLERGLRVLHTGIVAGRNAFGNVTKYLLMGTSSNFGNMLSMAGASLVLPFLPMLPTQILLNNLLYDLAQVTIPTDNVDPTFLRSPQKWNIDVIRRFMLWIGPVSSAYDFLTFFVLLHFFHASEKLFHTGWFVESLATQTLVIFVIRTAKSPLESRPSMPLALTTCGVVAIACALPFTPLAAWLGFEPLPASYFAFLASATVTYLALVQIMKRLVVRASRPS
jgi:Mg2+-importing ATPase